MSDNRIIEGSCWHCYKPLPPQIEGKRRKKYCNDTCKQAAYRNRVNVTDDNVTDSVTQAMTEPYVSGPDMISMQDFMGNPTPEQMIAARARRTDPDSLNWGAWMNSHELHEAGLVANRVPIPGDFDYVGCVA